MSEPVTQVGEAIHDLHERYRDCMACRLSRTRERIVGSRGCTNSPIVLISDRVSGHDEQTDMLLSGPVDQLITNILIAPKVELDPADIYYASLVLCRTPVGRPAVPCESNACAARLREELTLVKPRAIVMLGPVTGKALFPNGDTGQSIDLDGRRVPTWCTVHPREGLWGTREKITGAKREMYRDWQEIAAGIRSIADTG